MRNLARRRPLAVFFGLAFLLTWALIPLVSVSVGFGLIALFGPAAAAVITAKLIGPDATTDLRLRTTRWRVAPQWYVVAIGLPVAVSALASLIEQWFGAAGPIRAQPISALGMVVFILVFGEELGWRGFALPRLVERFGPWVASAAVGAIWGLWHLPLFFVRGMPQYGTSFPAFVLYTVGLSVLLTGFAQRTAGSLVIATVFHGAVNTFGLVNAAAEPALRGWVNALCYGIAAAVIGSGMIGRRSGSAP